MFLAADETPDAEIELTYNWGSDEDYGGARNFGHLAFRVDDIYATCEHLQSMGYTIHRPPRDGHMAFVRSPDQISIELLQEGHLPPQEPWASMANTGTSWCRAARPSEAVGRAGSRSKSPGARDVFRVQAGAARALDVGEVVVEEQRALRRVAEAFDARRNAIGAGFETPQRARCRRCVREQRMTAAAVASGSKSSDQRAVVGEDGDLAAAGERERCARNVAWCTPSTASARGGPGARDRRAAERVAPSAARYCVVVESGRRRSGVPGRCRTARRTPLPASRPMRGAQCAPCGAAWS